METGEASEKPKHWKAIERVVRLLESALDPSALVRHNVSLFDHSSDGPRQLDTVIESGVAPRQTRTIVEVQDREDPLGIGELQGFYQKMLGVHAQHLICVTRTGYTEQARNFARNTGPTIRLLTLPELEQGQWPVNFALGRFCMIENDAKPVHLNLKGSHHDNFALERSPGQGKIDLQARVFEFRVHGSKSKVMCASDLFRSVVDELPFFIDQPEPIVRTLTRRFGAKDRLWVRVGKRKLSVGWAEAHVQIQTRKHFIPLKMMRYEQQDFDGVIGWSALGEGDLDGRKIEIRAAFMPDKEGRLAMAHYEIDGAWRVAPVVYAELDTPEKLKQYQADVAAYDAEQNRRAGIG